MPAPVTTHAPAQPSPGPLSAQHLAELATAKLASRRLRRAASVARASAWTTGVFGGITLLGLLFGDLVSLILGVGLMAVALREGTLAGRLAGLDTRAPSALAINQLVLGCVIVAYAAWQVRAALLSTGLSAASAPVGDPQVDAMLADIGGLAKQITVAFYVCVALVGGASTGLMAVYYRTRLPLMRRFLDATPPWITQVMRAAA